MYTYILCVYVRSRHTNTTVLRWLFHFGVRDTRFQSLRREPRSPLRTKDWLDASSPVKDQVCRTVAACNTRLIAWANLIPVVTGLGTSWTTGIVHSPVLTLGGWKKEEDTGEWWRSGCVSSTSARCHYAGSCHPLPRPFHSTDSLLHFNKGLTDLQPSSNTLGITGT